MWHFISSSTILLLVISHPLTSWACSVCYSAESQSRTAYYGTTLLLTLTPLILIGALGWWIYRLQRS